MKFVVGIMLTAFGTFWGAEGAGADWPGRDACLLVIAPAIAIFAVALVLLLRRVAPPGIRGQAAKMRAGAIGGRSV